LTFSASIFRRDESACHPNPESLRQVERNPFNAGATIWRTTATSMLVDTDGILGMRTSRNTAHVGTTAQQPPQQDLLLALSFCRAVYGLTFRKGRSGML
jgi:hypothetical protein